MTRLAEVKIEVVLQRGCRFVDRRIAWVVQADGPFTMRTHERGNRSATYSARFDLDGLFETPVQANLARCGH